MAHFVLTESHLNTALSKAVKNLDYDESLKLLMAGAKATTICKVYGDKTPISIAAMVNAIDILELLIQSCEEPDFFKINCPAETEMDSTPDGMQNLEWEDEFNNDAVGNVNVSVSGAHDKTSLYHYYAKTLEKTGSIIVNINQFVAQDPNTVDSAQNTPLHYAANLGNVKCAEILLEHGAKVNSINSDGYTPLHLAFRSVEVARLLLKHGAKTNLMTIEYGQTPCHIAVDSGNYDVAKLLILEHNVDINIRDYKDWTPLIYAINNQSHNDRDAANEFALLLLDKGAYINSLDKLGQNALFYAITTRNGMLAKYLLMKGARRINTHCLLHLSIQNNLTEVALLLAQSGDSLFKKDHNGATPFGLVIQLKQFLLLDNFLKIFIAQGKCTNEYLEDLLMIAVTHARNLEEFMPAARIILKYCGPNWRWHSKKDTCRSTYCDAPLAMAIFHNKVDIAEYLIRLGVNPFDTCISSEHMMNSIQKSDSEFRLEFAIFLMHNGLRRPYVDILKMLDMGHKDVILKKQLEKFFTKPVSLQSLCRIVVRKNMVNGLVNTSTQSAITSNLNNTENNTALDGCSTGEKEEGENETALVRYIQGTNLPKTLKTFLINFNDCPTTIKTTANPNLS